MASGKLGSVIARHEHDWHSCRDKNVNHLEGVLTGNLDFEKGGIDSAQHSGDTPEIRAGTSLCNVMIRCPNTGEVVHTGCMYDATLWAEVADDAGEAKCPACGSRHHWHKAEAWLQTAVQFPIVARG